MKTQKAFIIIILTFFYFSIGCRGQQIQITPAQQIETQKISVKNSEYIFVGKVVKKSSIRKAAVTCFVVQITKILRGGSQLKLGTIKVIIDRDEYTDDAGPLLNKGATYIIFGKPENLNIFDSILTDNSIRLTYFYDPIVILGKAAQWGETKYPTVDSLYSFFKENGVTVQEEQK